MKKTLALALALLLALTACAPAATTPTVGNTAPPSAITADRAGRPITPPDKAERILSLSPAVTQTLLHLGLGDRLVAIDAQSALLPDAPAGLPSVDMMNPDVEVLLSLEADLALASDMTAYMDDPLKPLADAGVCVAYLPTSESIAAIKEDLRFVAAVAGASPRGEEIIAQMEADIAAVKAIGDTITDRKTVYFEIAFGPSYSFGTGVFLNEMIELAGGVNALTEPGWLMVADESLAAANPQVIFTNVNYIEDPVGEILGRAALQTVDAVQNGQVYAIDNLESSLPNEYIVGALKDMARALYPDAFAGL